jgi:hypothetical protein
MTDSRYLHGFVISGNIPSISERRRNSDVKPVRWLKNMSRTARRRIAGSLVLRPQTYGSQGNEEKKGRPCGMKNDGFPLLYSFAGWNKTD